VAAQLNSRVSDLVASKATLVGSRGEAQLLQEVQVPHPDVSKLQQQVVHLSVEHRDMMRELSAQGKSARAQPGAHISSLQLIL
jgi:t-SNARE complex subunit (syntaxin)